MNYLEITLIALILAVDATVYAFSYGLVLIAMNYVTNVSYVQVFRQLGLLVGVAGGIIILKERCSATKIIGSLLIVTGLIMTVL